MPRGGKRPGAGAPKGNLNALKHGRASRQVRAFFAALMATPHTRAILLKLIARRPAPGSPLPARDRGPAASKRGRRHRNAAPPKTISRIAS